MRQLLCCIVLCMTSAIALAADPLEVKGPWIATDRTVDCSSFESILAGVLKPGMTEEQKAIALYNFFRQMVYHYQNLPESRDPVKCINVIGNTLCGSQASCMKGLLEKAGIKARVVSGPGHTFYEAFYDGKWHGYDTMMNFYVFTRGEKPNVASFEEIKADNTLVTMAAAEKRAVYGMLACGDAPDVFMKGVAELGYVPRESSWSVKDYSLRPGEEIVRSWWPMGRPLPGSFGGKLPGPMHTCGRRDDANPPELFRFWEPYGIRGFGGVSVSYRHYFNGTMSYSPDLSAGWTAEALGKGELIVPIRCPFYITGATVHLQTEGAADTDLIEVAVGDGKKFTPIGSVGGGGVKQQSVSLDAQVVKPGVGLHQYVVRITPKGQARLKGLFIKTIFVHNAMAAPHLMPGANKVTFSATDDAALKQNPLTVTYRWKEAPAWSEIKTSEQAVSQSPATFEVTLPQTDKLPQMQDLTLRCGKLAWQPTVAKQENLPLCNFAAADVAKAWTAGDPMKLTHDGTGLVLAVDSASTYPQARMILAKPQDCRTYRSIVLEGENLGQVTQAISLRVQSNSDNTQRTDSDQQVNPGKFVMRIALNGLTKTKLDAVTDVYVMTHGVTDKGCKVRLTALYLEPSTEP